MRQRASEISFFFFGGCVPRAAVFGAGDDACAMPDPVRGAEISFKIEANFFAGGQ